MEENELKENKELVLFENNKIRRQMYNGEWFYSIIDIIEILTESKRPRKYWDDLKKKLEEEGASELSEKIGQLKMLAKDGKLRATDCANRETIFRLIQSIPSPNAEPFKLWFARLAEERIQEIIDPSLAIERAKQTYLRKGYSEEWTNTRIKGIGARNNLTNDSHGFNELQKDAQDGGEIASVTRKNIEAKIGKPVVTKENAKDFRKTKNIKGINNSKMLK